MLQTHKARFTRTGKLMGGRNGKNVLMSKDGNWEPVHAENWFPVVQFLRIFSLPADQARLPVLALALQSADSSSHVIASK